MLDTEFLDMLGQIGRTATARLTPVVGLTGATADDRRAEVLRTIRGTILPRRLEFTAANGDMLILEVSSSRVTDILDSGKQQSPDFDSVTREEIAATLAGLISTICAAPTPLGVASLHLNAAPEADDVGITISELERACVDIPLLDEPLVTVVADNARPDSEAEHEETEATSAPQSIARQFHERAATFADDRFFLGTLGETSAQTTGACAKGEALELDAQVLDQFLEALAGWDSDSGPALSQPQMIVMRPSGGKATGMAVVRDGGETATAFHQARKLGAVVSLWRSLGEMEK